MQYRSINQNNILHALLSKLGIDADGRMDLVRQFTNGRTASSAGMYVRECDLLITNLQAQIPSNPGQNPKKTYKPRVIVSDKLEAMRRKFFFYCHELGWKKLNGKLDYPRIDGWLTKYGIHHKLLNEYSETEIVELLNQMKKMVETPEKKTDTDNA